MSYNFEKSKSYVIDYLYDKLEVGEYKYNIVKNISNLYDLRNKKYYVSANSCGSPAFIILTKEDNNYYKFYVDRRSLSHEKQYLKKKEVRMKDINISVSKELYNGTIFDGIWIDEELSSNCRGNTKKKKYFVITDIFEFCGKKYIGMDYYKKMAHFQLYFNNYYNKEQSDVELVIQRCYEINNIDRLFKEYISENYKKYNIKGISFFPMYSGLKLIYLFDKEEDEGTKNSLMNNTNLNLSFSKDSKDFDDDFLDINSQKRMKKIYKFRPTDLDSKKKIILKFKLKKTSHPDVYNMYSIFLENGQYIMRIVDMAYIPTYALSIKMGKLFLSEDELIFDCELDIDKNEWIPISVSKTNKIDIINKDKRINVNEQYILDE